MAVVFDFDGQTPDALRFVGRLLLRNRIVPRPELLPVNGKHGPMIYYQSAHGIAPGYLLAPPANAPYGDRLLLVTCMVQDSDRVERDDTSLLMYGGFDPEDVARDVTRDSTVLIAKYPPALDAAELALMPTVDIAP
jgi:hypothetical protein